MCERVFKGNIVFAKEFGKYELIENGFIVVSDNKVVGVYKELPEKFKEARIFDYSDKIIMPGLVSFDMNSPLYSSEEIDSIEKQDLFESYAEFVSALRERGITRALINGPKSLSKEETLIDTVSSAGLSGFVSRLCWDRKSDCVKDLKKEKSNIDEFLLLNSNRFEKIKPSITILNDDSCSDELLDHIIKSAARYNSRINFKSDNKKNLKKLIDHKNDFYVLTDISNIISLSLKPEKDIAVYCSKKDLLLPETWNFIEKNIERASIGISLKRIDAESVFDVNREDINSLAELFYIATKGGGSAFGKVGSFEEGYEFDALIIDDSNLVKLDPKNLADRIDNYILFGKKENIVEVYVSGQRSLGLK